ncbi:MAG TPA: hypothetical protein PKV95_14255, partial [Anaerolineaceae bacterium]|nr:hypothetical protein [Anaerolineaceae bacterium]
MSQLTSEERFDKEEDSLSRKEYAYDAVGNRQWRDTSVNGGPTTRETYEYYTLQLGSSNIPDQLKCVKIGTQTIYYFTYDARGNMVRKYYGDQNSGTYD